MNEIALITAPLLLFDDENQRGASRSSSTCNYPTSKRFMTFKKQTKISVYTLFQISKKFNFVNSIWQFLTSTKNWRISNWSKLAFFPYFWLQFLVRLFFVDLQTVCKSHLLKTLAFQIVNHLLKYEPNYSLLCEVS